MEGLEDLEAKSGGGGGGGVPACPYGLGCYRKAAQHFAEFSHPTEHMYAASGAEWKAKQALAAFPKFSLHDLKRFPVAFRSPFDDPEMEIKITVEVRCALDLVTPSANIPIYCAFAVVSLCACRWRSCGLRH
jgi:hypothetical protein